MFKKLLSTTAAYPLGNAQQRRLLKVGSGPYSGRLAAVIQASPSTLQLVFSDAPYLTWSTPLDIATDCENGVSDAVMDADGNIHLVYPETGTGYLVTRKLTFTGGNWGVGAKSVIYNGASSFTPSLGIEPSGKLWVAWCRYSAPNRFVHVKSSTDGGSVWGSGAADPGQELTSGAFFEYAKLLVAPDQVHVIATYGGDRIVMRSIPIAGGEWSSEGTIASGTSGFTDGFDAAVRSDGLVAVVYNDSQFRYREFDGVSWGGITTLASTPVEFPQVLFRDQVPVVSYITSWSGLQRIMMVVQRSGGSFGAHVPLDSRAKIFDSVILWNAPTGIYQDVTDEAGSVSSGDLLHASSGALCKNAGDQIYLGMANRFRYAEFGLSTVGTGGTISYTYWDGSNWRGFTPGNGSSNLDQSDVKLVLWDDFSEIPADWQKRTVFGENLFWVKLEVQSAYATGPVGSHVTAISELSRIIFRR